MGILAAFCLLLAVAAPGVRAETPQGRPAAFLRTEFQVLGPAALGSTTSLHSATALDFDQVGGGGLDDDFGTGAAANEEEEGEKGSSNTGKKVKAGLLSAIIPGAGQFYNQQKSKAYVMFGVEVAIWTAYFVFDAEGDDRMDSATEWAGVYAGTSGEHNNTYWQNVGQYMDSDAYNEAVLREARALQEEPSGLVSGSDAWQWVNEDRREGYSSLRADGNSAYDRRDFMILFAVVNRAVSVVDAVLNAGKHDGLLETEVMGLNMELEMLPSFENPGARWVVSRSF